MSKILVVSGHPRLNQSLDNKTILETLKDKGADFTLLRLDEEGFAPQVEKDQALLKDADIIVFQFPIFWYSYPSLMKHWVEEVFAHGFAYGTGGTALKGKKFQISFFYHRFPCQCLQSGRPQRPSHGGFPLQFPADCSSLRYGV